MSKSNIALFFMMLFSFGTFAQNKKAATFKTRVQINHKIKVASKALTQPINWVDMSYSNFLAQFPNFQQCGSEQRLYIDNNEVIRLDFNADGMYDWVYLPINGANTNGAQPDSVTKEIFARNAAIQDKMMRFPYTQIVFKKDDERKNNFIKVGEKEEFSFSESAEVEPFLYQFEGPVLENDKVAISYSFNTKHRKGIFGKTTSKLVLDKVNPNFSYNKMNNWGLNLLENSNSAGLGTLFFYNGRENKIQTFEKWEGMVYYKLYEGPNLSAYKLEYKGVSLGNSLADINEIMVMKAGENGFDCFVQITNAEFSEGLLATGITSIYEDGKVEIIQNIKEIHYLISRDIRTQNADSLSLLLSIDNASLLISSPKAKNISTEEVPYAGIAILNTEKAKIAKYSIKAFWDNSQVDQSKRNKVEAAYKVSPITLRVLTTSQQTMSNAVTKPAVKKQGKKKPNQKPKGASTKKK